LRNIASVIIVESERQCFRHLLRNERLGVWDDVGLIITANR
jgi:hypothetical protein